MTAHVSKVPKSFIAMLRVSTKNINAKNVTKSTKHQNKTNTCQCNILPSHPSHHSIQITKNGSCNSHPNFKFHHHSSLKSQ